MLFPKYRGDLLACAASDASDADKVAMLHDGKIRWSGPVAELDESGDPYVEQFIHGRAEGPIEAVR